MHKVIVFPCGSQVAQEVSDSLYGRRDIYLVGVGSPNTPAYGSYDTIRRIRSSVGCNKLPRDLGRVASEFGAQFIFACNDSAQLQLSKSSMKRMLVGSEYKTCKSLSLKSKTYAALRGRVPVPSMGKQLRPPLFIKPDHGSGSKGCRVARTWEEASRIADGEIACEFIEGAEFTTDCFTDRQGKVLVCRSRLREEMRNGMSVRASAHESKTLEDYASIISATFGIRGAWFFQSIRRRDEYVVIEVNPRIASCSSITRASGANLALMSIMDKTGMQLDTMLGCSIPRQTKVLSSEIEISQDFDELFVDFDDCLIVRGTVNTNLVSFVYDCRNRGKKVTVISKHKGNLTDKLEAARILSAFDRVIHIKPSDRKAEHLHRSALLIDDSFREREEASSVCQCLSPDIFNHGRVLLPPR